MKYLNPSDRLKRAAEIADELNNIFSLATDVGFMLRAETVEAICGGCADEVAAEYEEKIRELRERLCDDDPEEDFEDEIYNLEQELLEAKEEIKSLYKRLSRYECFLK